MINKADKGSTIVVIDRDDYTKDALEHLADQSVYQQLASDTTGDIKKMISNKLDKLMRSGMLDKEMQTYCEPPVTHRTSRLYFLKKIHKNPMKIRPIVSSCNSVTENISEFVDHWLQPEVRKLTSYLKDTTAFINLLEGTRLPANCILASIDVSSLYTNIPHDEGKQFAMEALANGTPTPRQPPPEVLGELIDLVLKNNIFEFDGKHYLQIQGTAMGTKMAPAYANIFMGKIEDRLRSIGGDNILLWKRFIDDIFLVWIGTEEELKTYLEDINRVHRTIQFTCELSHTEINFLDTTLYKGPRFKREGILDIKTHIKPTNKQLYVHASSYHPPGTRKGIAIGEAKRYLRTNSEESEFEARLSNLETKLQQRGYTHSEMSEFIGSINFQDREMELLPKKKDHDPRLTLTVTYSDKVSKIKQAVKETWNELQQNPRLKMIFPDAPRIAYRKNPSLRNKLVRAQLKPVDPQEDRSSSNTTATLSRPNIPTMVTRSATKPPSATRSEFYSYKTPPTFKQSSVYPFTLFPKRKIVKPCFRKGCGLCKRLCHKSNFVKSKVNKRMYQVKPHGPPMTCHTKRVVYLIQCTECCKQYVGQTTKGLNIRINSHLSSIRGRSRHNMSWHFNNDHSIDCLSVTPVEKVSDDISPREAEKELQRLETLWILRLATQQPLGMNLLVHVHDTQSRI